MPVHEPRRGRVEKEELMKMLWPDSFVEERNLTVNISALRKALGESASDHRYVVTIPGQGYCFVADVKQLPSDSAGLVVEGHGTSRIVIREEVEREEERRTGQHKFLPSAVFASAWKTRRAILALLALIVLTAAVLYFWIHGRPNQAETQTVRSIAVLPFKALGTQESDQYLGLMELCDRRASSVRRHCQFRLRSYL